MTLPYLHKCAKCGESWWDAHVCATDVKLMPFIPKAAPSVKQRELTDDQIESIYLHVYNSGFSERNFELAFARAVLAAAKGGV